VSSFALLLAAVFWTWLWGTAGAQAKVVAPRLGRLKSSEGTEIKIDFSLLTASSVLFDAVFIPGGDSSVKALMADSDAVQFISEAYKHCKAIAASGAASEFVTASCLEANSDGKAKGTKQPTDAGVITGPDAQAGKIATGSKRLVSTDIGVER
jgi:catalase